MLDNGIETIVTKVEVLQPAKEQTMTRQTFKAGDRVRVKTSISSLITDRGKTGVVTNDHSSIDWPYKVQFDDGGHNYFKSEHLELLSKTLDDLTIGDVVVDKADADDSMTVAHVLKPGLYVLLDGDGDEEPRLYTATQLKNLDYVLRQDPEDDKTCLTVAEVAKRLRLDPDTLRIVADKDAA